MPTTDQHGNITVRVAAVTELAIAITSPAVSLARCRHSARVAVAGSTDLSPTMSTTDRHGNIAVRVAAVTELAGAIVPPAVSLARCRDSARVVAGSTDLSPTMSTTDRHGNIAVRVATVT